MTSLATLAHTTPPAFNGLFFATAATIVPILFLALAIQGRFFEELLTRYTANIRRVMKNLQTTKSTLYTIIAPITASAPLVIAALILVAGASAEIIAIDVLYRQYAMPFAGTYVFVWTIFLVIVVLFPPTVRFGRTVIQVSRELTQSLRVGNRPNNHEQAQPPSSLPEPRKLIQKADTAGM